MTALATTSILSQGLTPRGLQKAGANPSGESVFRNSVLPNNGYAPADVINVEPSQRAADYYRDGFLGGGTGDALSNGVAPRTINPWALEKGGEASIRLFGFDKKIGEDRDFIPPYTKFILSSVSEAHTERTQIVETFGQYYVFFFGERPPIYNFSGMLINSRNVNWVNDWMYMYDNFLRGSQCVQLGARILLTYGGRQVEGFMNSTGSQTGAQTEEGVPFQFQLIITDRKVLSLSDDFGVFTNDGATFERADFQELLDRIAGIDGSGTSDGNASAANNAAKEAASGAAARITCPPGIISPSCPSNVIAVS